MKFLSKLRIAFGISKPEDIPAPAMEMRPVAGVRPCVACQHLNPDKHHHLLSTCGAPSLFVIDGYSGQAAELPRVYQVRGWRFDVPALAMALDCKHWEGK